MHLPSDFLRDIVLRELANTMTPIKVPEHSLLRFLLLN